MAQSGNLGLCLSLPSCRNRVTLPMISPIPPATRLWMSCLWLQLLEACSGLGCPARLAPRGPALLTLDSFLDCPAAWPTPDPGPTSRPVTTGQPDQARAPDSLPWDKGPSVPFRMVWLAGALPTLQELPASRTVPAPVAQSCAAKEQTPGARGIRPPWGPSPATRLHS